MFLTLDVRYEIGLNQIYEKPGDLEFDPGFNYNVFHVSVGWKFL